MLTTDLETAKRIEAEIAALSEIYTRYHSFLQGIRTQVEVYEGLYKSIQLQTYKELRKTKRQEKKS